MKVVKKFEEDNVKRKAKFEAGNVEAIDFLNPTQDMIEDAKKNGIDLTDPAVQSYMAELQRRKMQKGSHWKVIS